MWSDSETTNDLLGFRVHADLLEALVLDDGILPVTIGVFGDWGSGKSSIMKMMENRLQALDDDTVCLYFNGWVFEGYDDAKAALLDSILKAFDDEKRFGAEVKSRVTQLFKSVNWMRAMGLGFKNVALPLIMASVGGPVGIAAAFSGALPTGLGEKVAGIVGLGEELVSDKAMAEPADSNSIFNEAPEEKAMLIREFRDRFEELLAETRIKRLVVLIDDLDRCSPERLIENLEAIKLFLNVPKTAFVIGADPRIVKHAIEFRYKSRMTSDDPANADTRTEQISNQFVKDYLEKLIQVPYHLPRLSDPEVETYLSLLFCEKYLTTERQQCVLDKFTEFRSANRYGTFGFGDIQTLLTATEEEQLRQSAPLITSLAPVITEGLKGNPRQIKRFLNSFTLRTRLAGVAKLATFELDVLAKLMVLEYVEPEQFRKLYDWQASQQGESVELAELESWASDSKFDEISAKYGAVWKSSKLVRWLLVEPKLTEVDLRDYFWLSRDQLSTSISGASLIPSHIKNIFRDLMDYGSETILRAKALNATATLTETEQEILLEMLVKEVVKRPALVKGHRIFLEFIAIEMPNALVRYKEALGKTNHTDIPYHIHNTIELISNKTPSIMELATVYDPKSKIGKAFITKKK
ncbi:NTPase [Pontibacter sp. Tf4]|uniref:KAP family P-loop NTPase fold protein n=1 Tax=Pontibacter sp. Tf4 TaxID=2761620 RepID=UPI001626FD9E|nr:P-loop NTPase fold protein [Pontibacter sp. Tf4]MBB6609688.1 NTPase [Pontibacter sp. Tf4]